MKTYKWLTPNVWRGGLMGLVLATGGPAMAASYNIILKTTAGTALACATGGFTFEKGQAGSFPTGAAEVTLTACPSDFVPGIANGNYVPGALSVVVEDVTLDKPGTLGRIEPLNQGPNVEGLTGSLQFTTNATGNCDGTGNAQPQKTYTITFAYGGGQNPANRTYTLACQGPGNFTTSGRYHVYNVANAVPEPESLALVVVGLGALALSGHILRRRKSPT